MAVGIYMQNQITPEKYDEAMRKLSAAGASSPKGRTYHAAFFEGDKLNVFDVWGFRRGFRGIRRDSRTDPAGAWCGGG